MSNSLIASAFAVGILRKRRESPIAGHIRTMQLVDEMHENALRELANATDELTRVVEQKND